MEKFKQGYITGILRTVMLSIACAFAFIAYERLVELRGALDIHDMLHTFSSVGSLVVVLLFLLTGIIIHLAGAHRLFKNRYYIAAALFVISVILGLNGSSIGMITQYLGGQDNDILFGISRGIRSDEWAIFTPFSWSQYHGTEPFSYFSDIIRATDTDVFLEYGQPICSFLMIFRPFQIGYLFLPVANAMAFFWAGRLITLFMVSFEFGRLITEDKRRVSVIYAFALTFAPAVQWWFAINGFVEMLIFMQLSIIMFDLFLKATSMVKKSIYIMIIAVCAGGYVLTMYPAWMIPLAYILLAFIIWTFIKNRKTYKFNKFDLIPMAAAALILAVSAYTVYKNSANTIEILSSTVYPGKRVSTGGGEWTSLFNYVNSVWLPLTESGTYLNTCESAFFISLSPIGFLLYIYYAVKAKKNDLLSIMLILISVFLGIYCIAGFPEILAKITMLSYTFTNRALVILTLSDLLLLVRAVHLVIKAELKISLPVAAAASVIAAAGLTYAGYLINKDFFTMRMLFIELVLTALTVFAVTACISHERIRPAGLFCLIAVILLSGILVNPIRKGVDSISDLEVLQGVSSIVQNDPDAVWIIEEVAYPYNNFLIMEGARTINSTNVYPNLELWESIDDGEDDSAVYNRYANIQIFYNEANEHEEFELLYPDNFAVALNREELDELNIDYIFTTNGSYEDSGEFELIYSCNGFFIYKNV